MNNHTNRLALASSPYLQQHAHNPVDWYEWGEEALNRARKENKPIIISIGYAACHWCHVMAHESFEDSTVAAFMNEHFISIKIDREERPDIDQVYMDAAQLITGRGGWPLNAFTLPDGRPFYAGTYYPKDNWMKLLQQIYKLYKEDYSKLEEQAAAVTDGIKQNNFVAIGDQTAEPDMKYYQSLFPKWERLIDNELGGYKGAPKFPLPLSWEFLLQYYYLTNEAQSLQAVELTLNKMARGGIYDQIGGGFSRYSVDESWKVPHFEKMLYDNGQLVSLYARAYQINKNPDYADVITESLKFIERELMSAEGGFYSSLDADSEGEEGKFYVWTKKELEKTLGETNAQLIGEYYQITSDGNWEHGNNILYRKNSKAEFAKEHNLQSDHFIDLLNKSKDLLFEARSKRTSPTTDDKILTSWNALMMKGYVNAYRALGDKTYLATAVKNASFIEKNMLRTDGSLWRNYKNGRPSVDAFLDDYALLADALMELYQVSFDKHWLDLSKALADHTLKHFSDEQTRLFYYTSDQSESLVARKFEVPDNVMPSSNSVLANVFYRLGLFYDNQDYINRSLDMLSQVKDELTSGGPYYANWAMLFGMLSSEPFEIAVMGEKALAKNQLMQKNYLPTSIFLGGTKENLALLKHKLVQDQTLIYVCKNKTCQLPVDKVIDAISQVSKL